VLFATFAAFVLPDITLTNPAYVIVAAVAVVGITVFAAIISAKDSLGHLGLIVPAVDFLAIGVLRLSTGEGTSVFAAMAILPIVWLASEEGRANILFATLGAATVVFMPFVVGQSVIADLEQFVHATFTTVIYALAAAVINELSRNARHRLTTVNRLVEKSRAMLAESVQHAIELNKSEVKVRETERMLRSVWNAVTEQSVIGTDLTGLIDAWNPGAARMLGVPPGEVENARRIDEFHLAGELMDRSRELNYPAGATVLNPGFSALVEPARLGDADVREWTYVRGDGTHIPVELSVTPRIDEAGEIIGYLFVAFDQTKAREVARLKDEFVGLISHELRTPLSSILGYLELMRDEEDTELSESQLRYLGVAERNAHRLLRLVGDLLFTAQVESGKFNLDQREQDLALIIAASVESARPVAAAAGIALDTELAEGIVVYGDAVRLGQAWDNLISNAIKFTPRGGTVTVGLSAALSNAVVTVHDTGMGIAPSELDKLFSRFFRASTATRNAIPGVGLGLVITKAIVRAHGGDMSVASEEGISTCFTITLPLMDRAKALAER
jgi:signal transduction histidine kinase